MHMGLQTCLIMQAYNYCVRGRTLSLSAVEIDILGIFGR